MPKERLAGHEDGTGHPVAEGLDPLVRSARAPTNTQWVTNPALAEQEMGELVHQREDPSSRGVLGVQNDDRQAALVEGKAAHLFKGDLAGLEHQDAPSLEDRKPRVQRIIVTDPAGLFIEGDLKPRASARGYVFGIVVEFSPERKLRDGAIKV